MSVETRLKELGITLPTPVAPVANYVPFVLTGSLLIISGQLPLVDGQLPAHLKGKVGAEVSEAQGKEAARLCAINVLAQMKVALGDLERVKRVVRLGGFINAAPGYTALPGLMNGASDLMVDVFGERGRHARTTVGNALPMDAAAEVEAMIEVA
jgi:enamine deaminase RidA (YjgF/YER057c/UK114 family)